jgi:hypothetical protein
MKIRLIGLGVIVLLVISGLYIRSLDTSPAESPILESPPVAEESDPSSEPDDPQRNQMPIPDRSAHETVAREDDSETEFAPPPPLARSYEEPEQGEKIRRTGSVIEVVSGLPVGGLTLSVAETASMVSTDEKGYFTLPALPPGDYSILIEDDFLFMANGEGSVSFTNEAGVEPTEIEVDVIDGGIIEGSVWMDEAPVEGMQVILRYPATDQDSPPSMKGQVTVTEEEGYFSFRALVPGEAQVQAYLQLDTGGKNSKVQLAIIESGAVTNVDFDFFKSLEGQLTFGDSEVQAAFVSVMPTAEVAEETQQFGAPVGDDGTYWVDGLPDGIHRVVAQASIVGVGNVQKFAWVETREGEVTYQSFDFTEPSTIVGIIMDLLPGENFDVLVLEGTDAEHGYSSIDFNTLANQYGGRLYGVDGSGRFTVTGLDFGDYTLVGRETIYNPDLGDNVVTFYGPAVVNLTKLGDAIMEIKRVR